MYYLAQLFMCFPDCTLFSDYFAYFFINFRELLLFINRFQAIS
jgi:hypothetical protein